MTKPDSDGSTVPVPPTRLLESKLDTVFLLRINLLTTFFFFIVLNVKNVPTRSLFGVRGVLTALHHSDLYKPVARSAYRKVVIGIASIIREELKRCNAIELSIAPRHCYRQ